ncbi:MAG: RNA polymerase subunit sigma-70 [Solirubrobacteraceae bacterium]|nr:RNA polymerase subunit sigma-70 [Solirubrobacteraceae bacterium]
MSTDHDTFETQVRAHSRELRVHCYRMTGSFEESEDLVQETFLRAWRKREQFAGRASLRAWLYKIATNACLDALDKRPRVPSADGEILWLQPYPDALLDEVATDDEGPDAAVIAKETIELTFITAIQHLAPLPRAVLVLRDVLDLSVRETSELLETTEASVNSALQRARAGMREQLGSQRDEWRPPVAPDAVEQKLIQRYLELTERADVAGLTELLHDDLRFTMPPIPGIWEGRERVVQSWIDGGFGSETFGELRCRLTWLNRQPAIAAYIRAPGGDRFEALTVEVLRFEDGLVREIVTFDGRLAEQLGLPAAL